jgi:hypothetical protein
MNNEARYSFMTSDFHVRLPQTHVEWSASILRCNKKNQLLITFIWNLISKATCPIPAIYETNRNSVYFSVPFRRGVNNDPPATQRIAGIN